MLLCPVNQHVNDPRDVAAHPLLEDQPLPVPLPPPRLMGPSLHFTSCGTVTPADSHGY